MVHRSAADVATVGLRAQRDAAASMRAALRGISPPGRACGLAQPGRRTARRPPCTPQGPTPPPPKRPAAPYDRLGSPRQAYAAGLGPLRAPAGVDDPPAGAARHGAADVQDPPCSPADPAPRDPASAAPPLPPACDRGAPPSPPQPGGPTRLPLPAHATAIGHIGPPALQEHPTQRLRSRSCPTLGPGPDEARRWPIFRTLGRQEGRQVGAAGCAQAAAAARTPGHTSPTCGGGAAARRSGPAAMGDLPDEQPQLGGAPAAQRPPQSAWCAHVFRRRRDGPLLGAEAPAALGRRQARRPAAELGGPSPAEPARRRPPNSAPRCRCRRGSVCHRSPLRRGRRPGCVPRRLGSHRGRWLADHLGPGPGRCGGCPRLAPCRCGLCARRMARPGLGPRIHRRHPPRGRCQSPCCGPGGRAAGVTMSRPHWRGPSGTRLATPQLGPPQVPDVCHPAMAHGHGVRRPGAADCVPGCPLARGLATGPSSRGGRRPGAASAAPYSPRSRPRPRAVPDTGVHPAVAR